MLAVNVANTDIPLDTSNCQCYCCFSDSTILLTRVQSRPALYVKCHEMTFVMIWYYINKIELKFN